MIHTKPRNHFCDKDYVVKESERIFTIVGHARRLGL